MSNPLAMYDLTIPSERSTLNEVLTWMRTNCKKWAFQQECGEETGYLHYQCRVSLSSKKRYDTMVKFVDSLDKGWHVSPTSNHTQHTGDEFYVLKEPTRVDGPWTDRTDLNPISIPIRLRGEPDWNPMQQQIIDLIEPVPDDRTVNLVCDPLGGSGKSFLTLWLMSRKRALRIPQAKDPRDIMRCVQNMPKSKCYFIDLPRATSKQSQSAMYAAIEEIKNGYVFDDRYSFKSELFEPPHVWVFSNSIPRDGLLTNTRWKIWMVQDGGLVPYIKN